MKKNRTAFIIIIVLTIIVSLLFIKTKLKTQESSSQKFAVDDTSNVTKIFLADKNNNCVTLKRNNTYSWVVNDTFAASKDIVNLLLKTMMSLDVKQPVSKSGRQQIMKLLATNSVKVEVYQKVFRIDLFDKIKWFPFEKLTKTYYVGGATQDNLGTYMLIEGSEEPCIIYIQGFNGFLYTRYSPLLKDWRDHTIFNLKYNQIKSIEVVIANNPEGSFRAFKKAPREFEVNMLLDKSNNINYDTLKVMELFAAFENIRYESLLNDLDKSVKDTLQNSQPYIVINVEHIDGTLKTVKTYLMKAPPSQIDELGNDIIYDRDRLYALINNDKDLVVIQFYVFGRLFKPLNYYKYGATEETSKVGYFEIIN